MPPSDVTSEPIRVALLGYGLAGRVFHAPLLAADPAFSLRAIVTSHPERSAQARADHPDAQVLTSADEVWRQAADFDLVVVASANVAHVPQARAALGQGLHVVVDKPVAGDATAAAELARFAVEQGRYLHVFQNRRWDSDFLTLLHAAERLGTVHRLESRFERWRPDPRGVWRESADPSALGGQLLDLGAHLVDQALLFMGPARAVTAYVNHLRSPDQADDDDLVIIEHFSGALSVLSASAVTAVPGPRFRVLGSDGGILIARGDTQEDALRAGRTPAERSWGVEEADRTAEFVGRDGASHHLPLEAGDWPAFYSRLADHILTASPPPVPVEQVIEAMRVLDAARASRGERVTLEVNS